MNKRTKNSPRLPNDHNRDHLMVQVAKSYYDLYKTQAEIGKDLGLTRWQVGKLLTEAREQGIVKIEIAPKISRQADLEVSLQRTFGLDDALVVPMGDITEASVLTDVVGKAAANYLVRMNPKPNLMGVSWGYTMSSVARALPARWNEGLEVVLLNGSTSLRNNSTETSAVAEVFAQSAGGTAILLPVPAIVGNPATRVALEKDPLLIEVFETGRRAEVVCFGMGGMSYDSVLRSSGYLKRHDFDRLRDAGAVGDVLGRFVDANGNIVDPDLDARTVGLSLDALRDHKRTIAVVAGKEKHQIALATLRAGLTSVLVTDEATARAVLKGHP